MPVEIREVVEAAFITDFASVKLVFDQKFAGMAHPHFNQKP
jgi:hypothetical protein